MNKNIRPHILTILTAIVALQFTFGASVFAGRDAKEYPGTVCIPEGDPSGIVYGSSYISSSNPKPSKASRTINCPLLRDQMSNKNGIEKVKVYVDYPANETSPWMWCRLLVTKPDTTFTGYTTLYLAYDSEPSTASTGKRWFEMAPKKKFPSTAYYSVKCRISRHTALASISVTEKNY